jgi:hypothetical protein
MGMNLHQLSVFNRTAVSKSRTDTEPALVVYDMNNSTDRDDWQTRKVREWLLSLLRFAITLEPADRFAVMSYASEMDLRSFQFTRSSPGFFLRETAGICAAIAAIGGPERALVLERHLARIEDRRLRQAFAAAIDLDQISQEQTSLKKKKVRKRIDLWKGLRC